MRVVFTFATALALVSGVRAAEATQYTFQVVSDRTIAASLNDNTDSPTGALAFGFNNNGDIVGTITNNENTLDSQPFEYNINTGVGIKIRTALPVSINNSGVFFGANNNYNFINPTGPNAFAYTSAYGPFAIPGNFPVPPQRPGYGGINGQGVVAGTYFTDYSNPNGNGGYTFNNGVLTLYSTPFSGINDSGQLLLSSLGVDINNAGDIVGNTGGPYVIQNGVKSFFVDPFATPITLSSINDLGQILGYGFTDNGNNSGFVFVATPVPEPASLSIIGLSLVGFLGWSLSRPKRTSRAH